MDIRIDPEFKDYLGPLDPEARQALEASLKREGCRDGLVIWRRDENTAILLDGHNRHEICTAQAMSKPRTCSSGCSRRSTRSGLNAAW